MKRLAAVLALVALVAVPAAAQRGHGPMKWLDEATLTAAKDLATDLTSWARTSVLPEAQSWKNQLDASLSAADLAKLNELRAKALALRERQKSLGATMRDAWTSENYDALKKARGDMKSLKAERAAILEQLKPIAVASTSTLEEIGQRAMPKVKVWSDEAHAIGEKWWQENKDKVSPRAAQAIGHFLSRRQDIFALLEPKLRTKAAAARFMLWNGEDFTREIDKMIQDGPGSIEGLDLE